MTVTTYNAPDDLLDLVDCLCLGRPSRLGMTDPRGNPDTIPRTEAPRRSSTLRASLLQHGAAWLSGLAAVGGLVVAAWLGLAQLSPGVTESPDAKALPQARSYSELIGQLERFSLPAGQPYDTYDAISDVYGTLTAELPSQWTDADGSVWLAEDTDDAVGVAVLASTDLDALYDGWGVSGAFVAASEELATTTTPDEVLDWRTVKYSATCTFQGRGDFVGATEIGRYEIWTACGNGPTQIMVLVAVPRDRSLIQMVNVRLTTRADLEALRHILDTVHIGFQMYEDTGRGVRTPGDETP